MTTQSDSEGPLISIKRVERPRYTQPYPLRAVTLIRRLATTAFRREVVRLLRPRRHARGVGTGYDHEAYLEQFAAQNIVGSLQERIFYQGLINHSFIPDVDFTFQAPEFGGRAELGGLVADFLFPVPRVIVQVQSFWHTLTMRLIRRDQDQTMMLEDLGYTVYEIWPDTIENPIALDWWIERHLMRAWITPADIDIIGLQSVQAGQTTQPQVTQ